MKSVFIRCVLSVVAILAANHASGAVVYSYIGNNYDTFSEFSFNPSMRISGEIVLDTALAPATSRIAVTPISFTFRDGVSIYTESNSYILSIELASDSLGNISEWVVNLQIDPQPPKLNDPVNYMISYLIGGASFDDGSIGTCSYIASNGHCLVGSTNYGSVTNNPGSWSVSAVPIPSAAWLLGSGALGLISAFGRIKKRE